MTARAIPQLWGSIIRGLTAAFPGEQSPPPDCEAAKSHSMVALSVGGLSVKFVSIAMATVAVIACATQALADERGYVASSGLDCRANPSTAAKLVEHLRQGDPITIIGSQET